MTQRQPILQFYGSLHALSSRGLHVRQSARSWNLILPMSPEVLESVRALCEGMAVADASTLLSMLDRYARSDVELSRVCLPRASPENVSVPQAMAGELL